MKKWLRQISFVLIVCLLLGTAALAAPAAKEEVGTVTAVELAKGVPGAEGSMVTTSTPVVTQDGIFVAIRMKISTWNDDWTIETVTFQKTQLVKLSEDGTVVGRVDLSYDTDYTIPICSDGTAVYVGLAGGRVAKVDADTLAVQWYTEDLGVSVPTRFAVENGKLYFGTYGFGTTYFCVVNTRDGSLTKTEAGSSYDTTPVVVEDKVYLGNEAGQICVFSAADGSLLKTIEGGHGAIRSSLVVLGDQGIINATDGKQIILNLTDDTVVKTNSFNWINRITVPSVMSSDGTLCYTVGEDYDSSGWGTVRGGYIAVSDGNTIKELKLPNHTKSTPLLVEDSEHNKNYLYVVLNYNAQTGENDSSLVVVCHDLEAGTLTCETLYTPQGDAVNASTSSVSMTTDGQLVYTNDSGYLFFVAQKEAQGETQQPEDKLVENLPEKDGTEEPNPPTGDPVVVWSALLCLSGAGLAVGNRIYEKKK